MKREYKLIELNEGFRLDKKKDIEIAETTLNENLKDGWQLFNIVSTDVSVLIGIFYRDVE